MGSYIDPSLKHNIMLFFSFCRTVPEKFQATCKLNTCINFDCIATPNPSLHTHPGIAQDYDGYRDGGGGSSRCDCEGEENQRQSTPKVCNARVERSWHTTSIPLSNRRICFYGSVWLGQSSLQYLKGVRGQGGGRALLTNQSSKSGR